MKKILLATIVAGSTAYAASGYGAAGCGLGSMLFGSEPGFMQVLAATTNATSGSQTFGITTGTSNCGKGAMSAQNEKLFKFVEANMDSVAFDISKGNGEYLDTMATYLKIDSQTLGQKLKTNFDSLYTKDSIEVSELMLNIQKVLNS